MDRPDPASLVKALRLLVNLAEDAAGSSNVADEEVSAQTTAPVYWIAAVRSGWRAFAERYERPLASEIGRDKVVRFLRANILPILKFEDGDRACRLCGFQCHSPARSWHPECWAALEPETTQGWKRITKLAFKRCGGKCESCGADFRLLKQATLTPWRKVYDFDHKIALINGGTHSADNIQVLCQDCHKAKTKQDLYGKDEWESDE